MTAFLSFLGHLTAVDWLFILIAWVLVAFALGTFAGLGIALGERVRPKPETETDVVNRLAVLPPVPTQADVDATWLDAWPTDMTRQQCDRLFDDLIAMEGLQ